MSPLWCLEFERRSQAFKKCVDAALDLILHPAGMETDSILVILCFKGVKTFDDVQKLKIIDLGLPQKRSSREYMDPYMHDPSVLQCRDAGAVPAGVAPLAGATIYLGAFVDFTVAQS